MATFEVDFIFYCPCFVSDIFESRFFTYKKKFEFVFFVHKRHPKQVFDTDNFKKDRYMLFTCLEHQCEIIYFDTVGCLYYYRVTFYQVIVDNSPYPKKTCYLCYRRSIKKLLKYFVRFVS